MISPDLLRFIRARQNEGMSRENITRLLINDGDWTREDVDEAFRVVNHESSTDADVEAQSQNTQSYITEDSSGDQSLPQKETSAFEEMPQQGIHTSSEEPVATSGVSTGGGPSSPLPFIIGAVLLVLGGIGVAAAFFGDSLPFATGQRPPEDIVEQMFSASTEVTSYSYSLEGTGTVVASTDSLMVPPTAQGTTEDTPETVTINSVFQTSGAVDITDPESPAGHSHVSFSLEEANGNTIAMGISELAAELETKTLGDTTYFNLLEAPSLGFFSLEPFENRWISVEMSDAQQLDSPFAPENTQEFLEESRETLETLLALNEEHNAVEITYEGTERIEGEQTFHYHAELVEENVYDFLVAAHEELSDTVEMGTLPTEEEVTQSLESVEYVSGDLYVSTDEYLPVRLALQTAFDDPESDVNGEGDMTTTFTNYNENVEVEAPEDAQPIEEVMQELFGGMMGGQTGTSTMEQDSSGMMPMQPMQ